MANNHTDIEKRLWGSAHELTANSKLKSPEYTIPVLRLIYLRYAFHRFSEAEKTLSGNIGTAINETVKGIEAENDELKGILPKSYNKIENSSLVPNRETYDLPVNHLEEGSTLD